MADNRLLTGGERNRGSQKKRFKDNLKASMKDFGIDSDSWKDKQQVSL